MTSEKRVLVVDVPTKNWGRHEGVAVFLRVVDEVEGEQRHRFYMAKRLAKDRPFCGAYGAPGGSVEEGETTLVGAVRELIEETGLFIDATRFVKLERKGPILTPVEQHGSGVPYFMQYYGVDLRPGEVPQVTEPEKQGPWELRPWMSWILGAELCPYSAEMIELFRGMPSRDE